MFHPKGNTYSEFGDVTDVDHLWGVIQEAAKAFQPHQILFVFQLKTKQNQLNKQVHFVKVCVKLMSLFRHTSLVISLTW